MPQQKEDPRMYVRGIPIPVPAQINYRDLYPEKIAKRKDNYFRRIEQMKSTGFNAVKHEPYKGIGDPFYLEEKKLVLHALGQWDESKDIASSSSSDEDDRLESASELGQKQTKLSAAKFVLRRSRKDLNTLNKEVSHGRNMIRNVRLGHGLFDLIEKERTKKKEAEQAQNKKKAEAMRNEWQPPKLESSSEEETTDDELAKEEELSSYLVEIGQNKSGFSSSDDEDDAETTENSQESENQTPLVQLLSRIPDDGSESGVPKSVVTVSQPGITKKKKVKLPRPYTPHHTNINESRDQLSRDSLFRQLCALNWILEAMKQDSLNNLPPVMSSWKLNDIGGWKTLDLKQRLKEKEPEWKEKIILGIGAKISKRTSRLHIKGGSKKAWGAGRNTTVQHTPASGYPQLTTPTTAMSSLRVSSDYQDETPVASSRQEIAEDEDDSAYKSIFKFLDENDEEDGGKTDESPDRQESHSPVHERRKKDKKEKRMSETETRKKSGRLKSADISKIVDKDGLHKNSQTPRERMSAQTYRAEINVRPKSSPQLLQFVANRPSLKYGNKVTEWNNSFRELQEDKALTLHDILENMERQRYTLCKNKFTVINMSTQGSSFHRAVERMRARSTQMFHQMTPELQLQRKKSQASSGKGNWYLNLKSNIPQELYNRWEYKNILNKLAKFGLKDNQSLLDKRRRNRPHNRRRSAVIQIEGAGQQHSMLKFIKVLGTLREWEICSPDISAAVEFARERIVDMSIEDFEAWFSTQFPRVQRPQTAPPRSEAKEDQESTYRPGRTSAASSRRPLTSAMSKR